jgi:hypothetical protein
MGYGKPSPAPRVEFSEDAVLCTPEEAKRVGLRIKGEACAKCGKSPCECSQVCPLCGKSPCECEGTLKCPACGKSLDACTCGICPKCGKKPCVCKQPLLHVKVEGAPGQVFQAIADRFHEAGKQQIAWMTIRSEGVGKEAANDARSMGLAIPQLGKGNYRIEHTMAAEFGTGPESDRFSVTFAGSWDRYKRVKPVTDGFGQEATKVNVKTLLRAVFDEGLDVDSDRYTSIRDIFTKLGLGRMVVEVEEKAGT